MNAEIIDQSLSKYLSKFKKLRIDRAHGLAPHKPILLLSILQSFKEHDIQDERIFITPELVAKFKTNWSLLVTTNHDCKFALPFFHLQSEKFWHLIPKPGFEGIIKAGAIMRNFSNLNAAIENKKYYFTALKKHLVL